MTNMVNIKLQAHAMSSEQHELHAGVPRVFAAGLAYYQVEVSRCADMGTAHMSGWYCRLVVLAPRHTV